MRLLERTQLHRDIVVAKIRAVMRQALVGQSLDQHSQGVFIDVARIIERNAILRVLEGRYATPDANFEPSAGHVIEHADFFDQAQWIVER
jgi:hypothetical protein